MTVRDHLGRNLAVGAAALAVLGVGALTMTERALPVAPDATAGTTGLTLQLQSATVNLPVGPLATAPAAVSTIVVPETAQPYLRDIDVRTFIAHTGSGDVEIELTSPARSGQPARTVRLVSGGPAGAAGANDIYDGTLWDDSASTLASDLLAVNLGEGSPIASLVPQGALGAFVGIDPRGTWTLRVTDRFDVPPPDPLPVPPPPPIDGGTLKRWAIDLATQSAPPVVDPVASFDSTGPAVPIQDAGPGNTPVGVTTSTILVSGQKNFLHDLDVVTNITHNVTDDIEVILSKDGVSTPLVTRASGPQTLLQGKTWNDSAATLMGNGVTATSVIPEGAMAKFRGMNPNGVWTLTVRDLFTDDTGTLNSWGLRIASTTPGGVTTPPPPPVTPPPVTPAPPVIPGPPPPPVATTQVSLKRFAVTRNPRTRVVSVGLGFANGTGNITYTTTLSTKVGGKTVRKVIRGSRPAGAANIVRRTALPSTWKGKRVTVRLVVKNGTTTIIRTRTIGRF